MSVAVAPGPLTTAAELTEDLLFRTDAQAAEWLAYVGLRGTYAAVKRQQYWQRWDGRAWQRCSVEDVRRAVRRALGAVYDRRIANHPTDAEVLQLLRLMDVNWHLGPLMYELRRVVTLDRDPA